MSDDRTSIGEVVTTILADLSPPEAVRECEEYGVNDRLWHALAEAGFTTIAVPEEAGGSGGDVADACAAIEAVGRFAAAVPIVETGLLAGWALSAAGLELPAGPATVATGNHADTVRITRDGSGWRLSGRLHRVPWARQAERVVLVTTADDADHVVSVRTGDTRVELGHNLAGEPRDTVVLDGVGVARGDVAPAPAGVSADALLVRGALGRAVAMAGALARVSDLTVSYTRTREQFGRPLARFQAVQRHIVRVTERAEAVGIAAEAAALNADPDPQLFDTAAAKIVAGESGTEAASAAHQAHGAIGMTREYELGQLSRRLWAWRDEFGGEGYWSRRLGRDLISAGAPALWPRISTGRTPNRPEATTG